MTCRRTAAGTQILWFGRPSPSAATLALLSAAWAASPAHAGPQIIEESARIVLPDPSYRSISDVAVDGTSIIVMATKRVPTPEQPFPPRTQAAFLFERAANGSWQFVRKLIEQLDNENFEVDSTVAMDDGIAAVNLGGTVSGLQSYLHVFERTPSGWVKVPARGTPEATDLELDAGTILASHGTCNWDALTFRENASGEWVNVGGGSGAYKGCDDEFRGGDVDISDNTFIVAQPHSQDLDFVPHARIFEGVTGAPTLTSVTSPDGPASAFAERVAIENDTAVVSGSTTSGLYVFERTGPGAWTPQPPLRPADTLAAGIPRSIEMEDGLVLKDHAAGIGIFRRGADDEYHYVAKLVSTAGVVSHGDISGRIAVGIGTGGVHVYDLPIAFSPSQTRGDDFQDGDATDWAPQSGNFTVGPRGDTLVYRQSSLAGNATSLLTNSAYLNHSIQAEVTPTAFDGSDRWFGLVARYIDAGNYYYVTLRSSNSIHLRKIVNGTFQTLVATNLPVQLNRTYRVRLEAIGTLIRVFVDDVAIMEARDSTHRDGHAGIMMYKTRADYDNVIVSTNPLTLLVADDFESDTLVNWSERGQGAWSVMSHQGSRVYLQRSTHGGARSVTGVASSTHQILQTRALLYALGNGANPWFGLMARYVDDSNYYYLTVRAGNVISLRKLVNGAIHELDRASYTVDGARWYQLRFEAIGNSLRAYIDGQLVLEATDDTFPAGAYGLAMYRSAAMYDDFVAFEP